MSKNKETAFEKWSKLIDAQRSSGLSIAAWCRQQGVSAWSFYGAMSRYRHRIDSDMESAPASTTFLELTSKESSPSCATGSSMVIEYKDARITLTAGCTPALLKDTLTVLREVSLC
jgi:hypothetical protein